MERRKISHELKELLVNNGLESRTSGVFHIEFAHILKGLEVKTVGCLPVSGKSAPIFFSRTRISTRPRFRLIEHEDVYRFLEYRVPYFPVGPE